MNRFLLDVNTLLALLDPAHQFHDAAHAWVASGSASVRWLTSPLVQNGVIRVASQPRYPSRLGTAGEVRAILQAFCDDPRHQFCPDDISLLDDTLLIRPELLTPDRITDLYLLALAKQHGARLATFDQRIPAEAVVSGGQSLALLGA